MVYFCIFFSTVVSYTSMFFLIDHTSIESFVCCFIMVYVFHLVFACFIFPAVQFWAITLFIPMVVNACFLLYAPD